MTIDRSRVVAVINGKGGVLKTSIVANVAGYLATGMRVLAIDLDPQGNLKLDFGLADSEFDDQGQGLVTAVWHGGRLPIVPDVRPNLDYVFGGIGLELVGQLSRSAVADRLAHGSVPAEFAARIGEIADDYDVILLDCPPGNADIQEMALAAAGWVLVPTRTDSASLDGLLGVGPRVKRIRESVNPQLRYLGVVITAHNLQASRVLRNVQQRLDEVSDTLPLLETIIRYSESAAQDCRDRGQLAQELAVDAVTSKEERLLALRASRRAVGEKVIQLPPTLSGSAAPLARDYAELAHEIVARMGQPEPAQ